MANRLFHAALAGSIALLSSVPASAETSVADRPAAAAPQFDDKLMTLDEAKARYRGPSSQVVLGFLTAMQKAVNMDKASASAADWQPVAAYLDRDKFHRVGNFAEHMGWAEYEKLLVDWAKGAWWTGSIWRMSEVPAQDGRPALVYVEALERSNASGPVGSGGKESTLESIAVYEIDRAGKIAGLHVYDHRPRQSAPR